MSENGAYCTVKLQERVHIMDLNKTNKPRLLTTKEACCYLFGEHSRSMASRLYRAAREPNSGLKSIRLLPSAQHYWSILELDELANNTNEVYYEKQ